MNLIAEDKLTTEFLIIFKSVFVVLFSKPDLIDLQLECWLRLTVE